MNRGIPRLAGQTALVTGAARRVGAQIVRVLHAAGANVAIHCHRSVQDAQRLAAELEQTALRQRLRTARGSVRSRGPADAGGRQPASASARLHLLVNNASTFYPTPLGTITPAQWEDLIGTNLRAPLFLAQAAAAPLRASRGSVLNIVDIHGLRPLRDHAVYSIAKAGLIMLTRALARELAPEVRVNGIAPGAVLWPENGMDEQPQAAHPRADAAAAPGSPADIARAVLFFASRCAVRNRTDPRGRRRPQHRLVSRQEARVTPHSDPVRWES